MAKRTKKAARKIIVPAEEMSGNEVVSLDECKAILEGFNLSDDRVLQIRNSVVGLVDSFLSAYVAGFKEQRGR